MRQIADDAGVSERTAYLMFPSKLELFMEVMGVASAGDDEPTRIAERPEFLAVLRNTMARRPWPCVSLTSNFERLGPLAVAAHESVGAGKGLREAVIQGERACRGTWP